MESQYPALSRSGRGYCQVDRVSFFKLARLFENEGVFFAIVDADMTLDG